MLFKIKSLIRNAHISSNIDMPNKLVAGKIYLPTASPSINKKYHSLSYIVCLVDAFSCLNQTGLAHQYLTSYLSKPFPACQAFP